mmetsp:Transcript_3004/g.8831  ORF Transcript_3004/g.8831 Transcript_3004/m.8831 type:complete len:396 (-) Transcript_3004:18-1205(-)
MARQGLRHAARGQAAQVLLVHSHGQVIEAGGLVAEVAVDGVVPRLQERPGPGPSEPRVAALGRQAALRGRPVVHGLRHLAPARVVVADPAAQERRRGREREEERRERRQLVVEAQGLLQARGLHGDLQAAGPHAEGHGVGVDVVEPVGLLAGGRHWVRPLGRRAVRLLVAHQGTTDGHLADTALADVAHERREARVGEGNLIGEEERLRGRAAGLLRRLAAIGGAEERHDGHRRRHLARAQCAEQPRPSGAHILLDVCHALEAAVRLAGSGLEHPPSELRHPGRRVAAARLAELLCLLQQRQDLGRAQGDPDRAALVLRAIAHELEDAVLHFVSPAEGVALDLPALHEDAPELLQAVLPNKVELLHGLCPCHWRAFMEKAHDAWAAAHPANQECA